MVMSTMMIMHMISQWLTNYSRIRWKQSLHMEDNGFLGQIQKQESDPVSRDKLTTKYQIVNRLSILKSMWKPQSNYIWVPFFNEVEGESNTYQQKIQSMPSNAASSCQQHTRDSKCSKSLKFTMSWKNKWNKKTVVYEPSTQRQQWTTKGGVYMHNMRSME